MDYRADCIPGYQYIVRSTPRSFGYSAGYLTGDGAPPNGDPLGSSASPTGAGISFPQNPQVGDYFLRIDYLPQILYRWDGKMWVRVSEKVRTQTGFANGDNQSLLSGFINDDQVLYLNNDKKFVPERQPLSSVLMPKPDDIPPQL